MNLFYPAQCSPQMLRPLACGLLVLCLAAAAAAAAQADLLQQCQDLLEAGMRQVR